MGRDDGEVSAMQDALKTYLAMATGLTEVSRKRAKDAAKMLAKQGGATIEQVQALTDDLLSTSRGNRESLTTLVRYEIDRALGAVGLATVDEVQALTTRIHELEAELRASRQGSGSRAATTGDADGSQRGARVAAAEARAEASAVKQAAKKAPAKTPAKKTATTDTAATKTAATKAPAKRAPAKRSPAKKAASPQAVATKPATTEVQEQVAEVKARKVAKLPATNPATATSESGGTEL
jgi:polyhydroxyalkanoate synthesis regulator phasin